MLMFAVSPFCFRVSTLVFVPLLIFVPLSMSSVP